MKRYVAFLLAVCMILSVAALAGCGKTVVPVENGNPAPVSGAESAVDSAPVSDNAEATEAAAVSTVTLNPTAFTAKAGDYELSFEPIALGGNTGGAGSHDFCGDYSEGKYYLSDKNAKKVFVYTINGTTADLEKEYDTETGFEKITANHNGDILLSQGIFEAYELLRDGNFDKLPFKHDLECSKKEDFAVLTWVNADPTVIHNGEEGPWVFENINDDEKRVGKLSMVFDCEIVGDDVLIGGTYMDNGEENYRIGIFDYDGNEKVMSAAADPVGYTALYETDKGVISANVSKLYLHSGDLEPVGQIKDLKTEAGFDSADVSTFWVKDFCDDGDGNLLMLVYVKKTDDTTEPLLYKVTGF